MVFYGLYEAELQHLSFNIRNGIFLMWVLYFLAFSRPSVFNFDGVEAIAWFEAIVEKKFI